MEGAKDSFKSFSVIWAAMLILDNVLRKSVFFADLGFKVCASIVSGLCAAT